MLPSSNKYYYGGTQITGDVVYRFCYYSVGGNSFIEDSHGLYR